MRLLLIIALVAVVAAAFLMIARSGPRVTRIEHRRDEDEEDRDDA